MFLYWSHQGGHVWLEESVNEVLTWFQRVFQGQSCCKNQGYGWNLKQFNLGVDKYEAEKLIKMISEEFTNDELGLE